MQLSLYNPFKSSFKGDKCFLTGIPLNSGDEQISVFPQWLMDAYDLNDKPFKFIDESVTAYSQLRMPCSAKIHEGQLEGLENKIQEAFMGGFESASKLDELSIFQWVGKLVYGLIYHEIKIGLSSKNLDEPFHIAPALLQKFTQHHYFLQSISASMELESFTPWSLFIFKINDPGQLFEYRNEINTMTFSMRMKNFGLIMCLQDNGANKIYHSELVKLIGTHTLHPIQYEEFSAKVFYSAYLYNRIPEYDWIEHDGTVYISISSVQRGLKPFDEWVNKTYAQVLEAFWKPWNFHLMEILKDPNRPMTFLTDEKGFRESVQI